MAETTATEPSRVVTLTVEEYEKLRVAQDTDAREAARDARMGEILAQARQPRPENEHLPPSDKPALKCKMLDCGFPVSTDVYTKEQLELLNQVVPGSYWVIKGDLSKTEVKVVGEYGPTGDLRSMAIHRDTHEDRKHNWPPFVDVLRQIVAQAPRVES